MADPPARQQDRPLPQPKGRGLEDKKHSSSASRSTGGRSNPNEDRSNPNQGRSNPHRGRSHRGSGRLVVRSRGGRRRVRHAQQVPESITDDPKLKEAMKILPKNYNFEVPKTIWRIRMAKAKRVGLQFPEGLVMYSCILSDIIHQFTGAETLIMGDVTYGACCVDDLSSLALGCDFLVHYGHSCLVPVTPDGPIKMLYVFVEIAINVDHLCQSLVANFCHPDSKTPSPPLILAGTIQFTASIRAASKRIRAEFPSLTIPQTKPLSPGEVLGCTAPRLDDFQGDSGGQGTGLGQGGTGCGKCGDLKAKESCDGVGSNQPKPSPKGEAPLVVFVADGRFHLESLMIQNPHVKAFYKYDPYSRKLTTEKYDHDKMKQLRSKAIHEAAGAKTFGLILGSLGRQGNPRIVERLKTRLKQANKNVLVVLLSEIFPAKLEMFKNVDAWIQVACPRLSIDWGHAFKKPLLSSYEAEVALGLAQWKPVYPMDFYSTHGGPWSNYHKEVSRRIGHRSRVSNGPKTTPVTRRNTKLSRKIVRRGQVEIAYETSS